MSRTHRILLMALLALFGVTSVVTSYTAEAGLFSLVRKTARKADDGAGSIGHKFDIDGLKHFDVEPGTHRFGLATNADGSLKISSMDGQELHIRSTDNVEKALAGFQSNLRKSGGQARFFVSQNDLFRAGKSAPLLTKIKGLHVITGKNTSLPVRSIGDQHGLKVWGVEVRKGMIAITPDKRRFSEAVWRMEQMVNSADVHVVSFARKAPDTPDALNLARSGQVPDPTLINPAQLDRAFNALRGKKLIVSGKVEGNTLLVDAGGGGVTRLSLDDMRVRAQAANIDLIILGGKRAAQPGKKSLFGRSDDKRLTSAFKSERYGDFLVALGGQKNPMIMNMDLAGKNHVVWRSSPTSGKSKSLYERIEEKSTGEGIAGQIAIEGFRNVTKVTGEKEENQESVSSIELNAKSKRWQKELNGRIIPFVPVITHILYIGNVIAGLLAWTTSSWLWDKIWKSRDRHEFSSKWSWFGYRSGRNLVMIVTLMGAIGIILLLIQWAISGWQLFLAILRFITWPIRKLFSLVLAR